MHQDYLMLLIHTVAFKNYSYHFKPVVEIIYTNWATDSCLLPLLKI